MALRNAVRESDAAYADPLLGVNLWAGNEDLKSGEAMVMQNMIFRGGTRVREGSQRLTPSALALGSSIRGGHKFYYGGSAPLKKRLVAYADRVVVVNDAGNETVLTTGLADDRDMQFLTWSITDKVYMANKVSQLMEYDGTTFTVTGGTNIPVPRWIAPIGDRLMAITPDGIERCDARNPTIWSKNSAWATLRPSRVGLFTTIHPVSMRGSDTINAGLLAFQPNSYYLITGTDFGTDVTSTVGSVGEDSKIQLLDSNVGTASPFSVVSIPGIGTAWFTSDLNVYLLPEGSLKGQYIGDRIRSNGSITGIESTATPFLDQVWMAYFDRYLMLGIPTGVESVPVIQYWMDMYSYTQFPDRGPVWYGPMLGQSLRRVWVENQQSDFAILGGEGRPSTGAFVYQLRVPRYFQDSVGLADNGIAIAYQTYLKSFGAPTKSKYLRSVHYDLTYNPSFGVVTADFYDINGPLLTGASIDEVT